MYQRYLRNSSNIFSNEYSFGIRRPPICRITMQRHNHDKNSAQNELNIENIIDVVDAWQSATRYRAAFLFHNLQVKTSLLRGSRLSDPLQFRNGLTVVFW